MEIEEKLDIILNECKARHSRPAPPNTWYGIATKVCDPPSDEKNPFLSSLITDLIDGGYIRHSELHALPYLFSDIVATIKGLTFEGFVNQKARMLYEANEMKNIQNEQNKTQISLLKSQSRMTIATWILALGTLGMVLFEAFQYFGSH